MSDVSIAGDSSSATAVPAPVKSVQRAKGGSKRKKDDYGDRLTVLGDRFVGSYSGRLLQYAVFVPGLQGAFANLPCAFAWLEDNVKDQTALEKFKKDTAEKYEQSDNIVRAPMRSLLMDFGGELDYDSWMGPLIVWDAHTEQKGITVSELAQSKRGGPVRKKKSQSLEFKGGMYVLYHNKASKPINATDLPSDDTPKGKLTPMSAVRKLEAFRKSQKDGSFAAAIKIDDHFIAHITVHEANGEPVDAKLLNKTATTLTGVECFGPAVVIFTKKTSVSQK